VTTVEGLSEDGLLHPVQQAWLEDDTRLADVFRAAAERTGWPGATAPGTGTGIAGGLEKGGRVATAAQVRVDTGRTLHVDRLRTAGDTGPPVTPESLVTSVTPVGPRFSGPAVKGNLLHIRLHYGSNDHHGAAVRPGRPTDLSHTIIRVSYRTCGNSKTRTPARSGSGATPDAASGQPLGEGEPPAGWLADGCHAAIAVGLRTTCRRARGYGQPQAGAGMAGNRVDGRQPDPGAALTPAGDAPL